jgi:hypothetical protein
MSEDSGVESQPLTYFRALDGVETLAPIAPPSRASISEFRPRHGLRWNLRAEDAWPTSPGRVAGGVKDAKRTPRRRRKGMIVGYARTSTTDQAAGLTAHVRWPFSEPMGTFGSTGPSTSFGLPALATSRNSTRWF